MRIVAITAQVDDIVTPTQAAVDSDPELRAILSECRTRQGVVTDILHDGYWCPLEITFENGAVYYCEQVDLEK